MTSLQRDRLPFTKVIVDRIMTAKPMHRKFLSRALSRLTDDEALDAEKYIVYLLKDGLDDEYLVRSYLTIVEDTFREELYFRENGSYRYSSFAEAQEVVYNNADYMHRYMIGLALSAYWWLNHLTIKRFFNKQIPLLSKMHGLYREVGPGHGMYFLESISKCNFEKYQGIDISPTSVSMTKKIVTGGYFGDSSNVEIILADFLESSNLEKASALVMGEILEHVENPENFLERAYDTTTDDAFVFLTTCINSPAIDHLYNPGSVEALEKQIKRHGFYIKDSCIVPRDGASFADCEENKLAINVAYALEKHS